jgi:hypothetical protein
MVSGAIIYIPYFIKIDSGIRKLIGGNTQTRIKHIPTHTHTHTHTHTEQRDRISLLHFSK